ncbi:MAG: alpha/beta fold hydrolase [Hyphomonadaceae bacterium]|nr:alpha/beta fold hydrolase [Hyphomonadaceae bacterium]MCA8885088.1 alpha/beta fold hydrolase [Hyphomonadaceae bacterium]
MTIDEQARALLKEVMTPKRRARQRIAEPLRDAQPHEIETSAGKIAAWRYGEGPAVLLVHGWQDDNSLWSPLISALAELGIASVAFDLPGHGFSGGETCSPTVAAQAVLHVAEKLGPIDAVVTHSFGGPVTGFALLNGFAPRRIALIAPPRGRNRRWFDFAEERGISTDVVHRAREIYAAEAGLQASFDLAEVASPIETLVLHSMDDDAVEWENGEAIAQQWPNAELVLCDGLGHRMIAQDRSVIERIVNFVA